MSSLFYLSFQAFSKDKKMQELFALLRVPNKPTVGLSTLEPFDLKSNTIAFQVLKYTKNNL